jgi:hypothetical protein
MMPQLATFTTDYNIIANIEGQFNGPLSEQPKELAWFSGVSGGQVEISLPDEGVNELRLPDVIKRLSREDGVTVIERFLMINFTDEQVAQVMFFRKIAPRQTQSFTIAKPLRAGIIRWTK